MSLKSRINRLILKANSSKQTDRLFEQKMAAIEAELKNLSDEQLRRIASGEAFDEFTAMSEHELWR